MHISKEQLRHIKKRLDHQAEWINKAKGIMDETQKLLKKQFTRIEVLDRQRKADKETIQNLHKVIEELRNGKSD